MNGSETEAFYNGWLWTLGAYVVGGLLAIGVKLAVQAAYHRWKKR